MAWWWIWPAGTASYLVLAGSFSSDELVTAAILGGLGALWHAAVIKAGAERLSIGRDALPELGRALAGLPGATLRVGARLLRGSPGHVVEVPFLAGDDKAPVEVGRRAIVVLGTSLAPDSYVLRLLPERRAMLCHALTAKTPGGDPRWPA